MTRPHAAALIAQRDRIANRAPVPQQGDRTMTTQYDMVQAAAARRVPGGTLDTHDMGRRIARAAHGCPHRLGAILDAVTANAQAEFRRDVVQAAREAGL
jgi:hypothetical protein